MLNLVFAQHAIACVLCELLCLELFTVFFQHEYRFRYKFFRYCSIFKVLCAFALRLTTWLFYHRSGFLSSTFLRSFWSLANLEHFKFLGASRELVGVRPLHLALQDRSVCLNAPLGRFIAFATAKLLNVHWFFSRASCWAFRSHSFVSALGAQV